MEKKIKEGVLLPIKNYDKYRVNIRLREDKIYLGNKNHEVSYYLNNWDIIN
jgi:hypothetical protein